MHPVMATKPEPKADVGTLGGEYQIEAMMKSTGSCALVHKGRGSCGEVVVVKEMLHNSVETREMTQREIDIMSMYWGAGCD